MSKCSDLFKKKFVQIGHVLIVTDNKNLKWEPLLDSFNSGNSGQIWTNFFFK